MEAKGPKRMGEAVVTRFAPSPTGPLHLGHAYSAARAYRFARDRGGAFLLRIEDIDGTRSRAEHVAGILDDLAWLGLEWDEPVEFQSARLAGYAAALDVLKARGLVYPCFCTRAEVAGAMSAPHGRAPTYSGTCRGIDAGPRMDEPHAWRLDMAAATRAMGPIDWWDERAGLVRAVPEEQGDVVLARKGLATSYHLAVTADDAAQGVTDVVRGVDLFEATHVHRLLQALLGLSTPRYRHHPLLLGPDGERLAKRRGSPSLASLRAGGTDGRKLRDGLMEDIPPAGFSIGRT